MSNQSMGADETADYAEYMIPAGEDRERTDRALTSSRAGTDRTEVQRTQPQTERTEERAVAAGQALEEAAALANLLVAPLTPIEALGEALLIGLRLLPDARQVTIYAVEDGSPDPRPDVSPSAPTGPLVHPSNPTLASLVQLACARRTAPPQPPALDVLPRPAHTLGLGSQADTMVLGERRVMEADGASVLPLRAVGSPEVAGALVVAWEGTGRQGPQRQPALTLLASCCAVLVARTQPSDHSEAQRHLAESLSLIVHELRSPLTAVKGYAQLLMRQARRLTVPPQTHQAIAAIDEQATRMADMISEMHDAVRIRRGDLDLHPEALDIVPLIARAVEKQRRLFPQHTMTLQATEEPLISEVDPQRLEQVVSALLNNAARYTPSGGAIDVRVAREIPEAQGRAPQALVSVRDHGIGVAPAERGRIFEYLYRAPESRHRHLSGLGLGLFVSHSLIERMGGHLWLHESHLRPESAQPESAPGAAPTETEIREYGSVFCFTVPLLPLA